MLDITTEQKSFRNIKELYYQLDENEKIVKFKPWLGDAFSFLYDRIMQKSIFPKKFNTSILEHYKILQNELSHYKNKNIIEIATGSGDAINFLNPNCNYTGCDISPGLLRRAYKKFIEARFNQFNLYVADACELPFIDNKYDIGICNLSLNFFKDIELFILELKRVLKPKAIFYCSIPVKDRLKKNTKIQGTIFHEKKLKSLFEDKGFNFFSFDYYNGALLYFSATPKG